MLAVVFSHPPGCVLVLSQLFQPLFLGFLADMEEELYQEVAPCGQLAFKYPDAFQTALIFLIRQVPPHPFPDSFIHPPRIQEQDLSLFRNRLKVSLEERPALFLCRGHPDTAYLEEPGIQLPDQGVDHAALAGGAPAFYQYNHRQLGFLERLLQGGQIGPPGL